MAPAAHRLRSNPGLPETKARAREAPCDSGCAACSCQPADPCLYILASTADAAKPCSVRRLPRAQKQLTGDAELGLRGRRDSARFLAARRHPSIPALGAAAYGGFGIQGEPRPRASRPPGFAAASRRPTRRRTRCPHVHRAPLTPEQRDARRRAQLDQLRQATSALLTSEGWQRWLRTRSRFHRYSLRNTLLIAFQCPHATHVAGFRAWLELGRCVRKGENAIRIFAPVRYRRRDDDAEPSDDENTERLVGFKLACVFDVSQTEPLPDVEPAPLDPPGQPVSGDSHAHLLAPLEQHAASLGYTVGYEPLDGRAGYCSAREQRIVIDTALPANGQVTTLVHELAHAHGIDYQRFSRPEAELIVESVACIVCAGAGLDTSSESVPYLAGWNPEHRPRAHPAARRHDRRDRAHDRARPPR